MTRINHERANLRARVASEMHDDALDHSVGQSTGGRPGGFGTKRKKTKTSSTPADRGEFRIIKDLRAENTRLRDDYAKLERKYAKLDNRLRVVENDMQTVKNNIIKLFASRIAASTSSSPNRRKARIDLHRAGQPHAARDDQEARDAPAQRPLAARRLLGFQLVAGPGTDQVEPQRLDEARVASTAVYGSLGSRHGDRLGTLHQAKPRALPGQLAALLSGRLERRG